jgi:ornithine decarboxylase
LNDRPIQYGASEEDAAHYHDLVKRFGSPLLVVYRDKLLAQYELLCKQLPGVTHYYAIKAFPYEDVLRILANAGASFDVASAGEIDMLRRLYISGRRTIHTHPIKKSVEIRAALRGGSTTFVVDNIEELQKLLPYRHRVGILLRVSFRSSSAKVDLSRKFGCAPDQVTDIVREAASLGANIRGLSFHVGSQSLTPDAHVDAINRCASLIGEIEESTDRPMNVLDIGGGFPVDYARTGIDYDAYFKPIREALSSALPDYVDVIAEPGRFLVAPAATSIASVAGKARRGDFLWYYLDDGVYGCYSGQLFDHTTYPLQILNDSPEREPSIIAGPTCDSIDVIAEDIQLPALKEGDLVIGHMMGAYTYATAATRFNSLSGAKIVVI